MPNLCAPANFIAKISAAGLNRHQGSNALPDHLLPYPASIGIARRIDEPCRCDLINGKQGAFSGHSRDRQNPIDLTKLAADIWLSLALQVEPS